MVESGSKQFELLCASAANYCKSPVTCRSMTGIRLSKPHDNETSVTELSWQISEPAVFYGAAYCGTCSYVV